MNTEYVVWMKRDGSASNPALICQSGDHRAVEDFAGCENEEEADVYFKHGGFTDPTDAEDWILAQYDDRLDTSITIIE